MNQLTQAVIDAAPDGAEFHCLYDGPIGMFYKRDGDRMLALDGDTPGSIWEPIRRLATSVSDLTPLPPKPASDWTSMPELPKVAGVCRVRWFIDEARTKQVGEPGFSYFDGRGFGGTCSNRENAREFYETVLRRTSAEISNWIMIDPDAPAEAKTGSITDDTAALQRAIDAQAEAKVPAKSEREYHKGIPRESLAEVLERKRRELAPIFADSISHHAGIREGDRDGIAAFTPPPEPPKVVQTVRVSSVERAWWWLPR